METATLHQDIIPAIAPLVSVLLLAEEDLETLRDATDGLKVAVESARRVSTGLESGLLLRSALTKWFARITQANQALIERAHSFDLDLPKKLGRVKPKAIAEALETDLCPPAFCPAPELVEHEGKQVFAQRERELRKEVQTLDLWAHNRLKKIKELLREFKSPDHC